MSDEMMDDPDVTYAKPVENSFDTDIAIIITSNKIQSTVKQCKANLNGPSVV